MCAREKELPDGMTVYQRELFHRLGWFIRFRWLLVLGAAAGLAVSALRTGMPPVLWTFCALLAAGALCNLGFSAFYARMRRHELARRRNVRFAMTQVAADLVALTVLVHLTGGLQSVLVVAYTFHMVVAGVLLRPLACFFAPAFASALLDALALLEKTGTLPHYHTAGFTLGASASAAETPLLTPCLVYNVSFFVVAFMASSVSTRLRSRNEQIERMNERLKAEGEARTAFTRMTSHELRTPLLALRGLLQILGHRLKKSEADAESQGILRRSLARLDALQELVLDLLHYCSLGALEDTQECEVFDWSESIASALQEARPAAEARGIALRASLAPCLLYADEREMRCVARNLISNALRYARDSGTVSVRLAPKGDGALLEVADDGIGIEEEALGRIFDEFFRGPRAREHEPSGTGLGLTMCKRIVEHFGGSIVARNAARGAVFTVRMPLQTPSSQTPEPAPPSGDSPQLEKGPS